MIQWIIFAFVLGLIWAVHVHLYPLKICPTCHGAKEHASGRARRICGRCGGTGRVRRFGARRDG